MAWSGGRHLSRVVHTCEPMTTIAGGRSRKNPVTISLRIAVTSICVDSGSSDADCTFGLEICGFADTGVCDSEANNRFFPARR